MNFFSGFKPTGIIFKYSEVSLDFDISIRAISTRVFAPHGWKGDKLVDYANRAVGCKLTYCRHDGS